jgi:hypothetical protein
MLYNVIYYTREGNSAKYSLNQPTDDNLEWWEIDADYVLPYLLTFPLLLQFQTVH